MKKLIQISVFALGLLMIFTGKAIDKFIPHPEFKGVLEEMTWGGVFSLIGFIFAIAAFMFFFLRERK